jgi:hypothetical protein
MAYTGSVPSAVTDDAYTATLQEITDKETKSQTYSKMPAFQAFFGNKQSGTAGSNRHEWTLRAGRNSNAKTMTSDADTVEFSAQSHVITAYYDYMAMNAVPVLGSKLRDSINSGPQARVSLIKEDLRQASETLSAMLSSQAFGDGSAKTIIGADAILNTAPGSNTVYGVPEASAAFWKNYFVTSFGSFAANGLHGSSDDKLTRAYLVCSDNGFETPDKIVSDRLSVEYFIRAEGQKKRITKDADFGVIGRGAIGSEAGRGLPFYDAEWVWDNECPTGRIYMFHSEDFVLVEDPAFNFKWHGPIPLGKQFLLNGRVLTHRAQSKAYRRNRNAVLDGITA